MSTTTKKDANNNNSSSTGLSKQKVEDYVADIICKIKEDENLDEVDEVLSTLNKMQNNLDDKHRNNYFKVVQCLGEVGIEDIIHAVLLANHECCDHFMYSSLCSYVSMMLEVATSVNVLKRILYRRHVIVPTLFRCLRQVINLPLKSKAIEMLMRLILVCPRNLYPLYLQEGFLCICVDHLTFMEERNLNIFTLDPYYIAKILQLIVEFGNNKARHDVQSSTLFFMLHNLAYDFVDVELSSLRALLVKKAGKRRERTRKDLPKWRLRDELSFNVFFCSSPMCRKKVDNGEYKYCADCKLTRYCSQNCQKYHWSTDHKYCCLKLSKILDL